MVWFGGVLYHIPGVVCELLCLSGWIVILGEYLRGAGCGLRGTSCGVRDAGFGLRGSGQVDGG